ncbi:hypothetical protein NDU88_003075 [Pleurodeles waltl]|uniref:Secreted protein n=1 Tax=Pleurodeles waltl TaxID=8319 RepID=A0AAV7UB49_PLEWA|nr:hypothetical protein NDU88_003075 [Pleurodeles waltl]
MWWTVRRCCVRSTVCTQLKQRGGPSLLLCVAARLWGTHGRASGRGISQSIYLLREEYRYSYSIVRVNQIVSVYICREKEM